MRIERNVFKEEEFLLDSFRLAGNTEAGFQEALTFVGEHTEVQSCSPVPYLISKEHTLLLCETNPYEQGKMEKINIESINDRKGFFPEVWNEALKNEAFFMLDGNFYPLTKGIINDMAFLGITRRRRLSYHTLGAFRELTEKKPIKLIKRSITNSSGIENAKIFSIHSNEYCYAPQNEVVNFVMENVFPPEEGGILKNWEITHVLSSAEFAFEGKCEERSYGIYENLVLTPMIRFENSDCGESSLKLSLSWAADSGTRSFLASGKDKVIAKHTGNQNKMRARFLNDAHNLLKKTTALTAQLDKLSENTIAVCDLELKIDKVIDAAEIGKIGKTITNIIKEYCFNVLNDGLPHSEAELALTLMAAQSQAKSRSGVELSSLLSHNQVDRLNVLISEVPYKM